MFDDVVRTDPRPASHLESSFRFLNRVSGPYWEQVRALVQDWLNQVQDDAAYRDLRARMRSDNAPNYSAFLELYLHEMLRRAGYRLTIHPDVPGSTNHPDFLVEGHGESFYLEATMPGPRGGATGAGQRRAAFLDTMQGVRSKNFYLSLDELVVGPRPLRGTVVRDAVDRWLSSLDPDRLSWERSSQEPFRWAKDGWEVQFTALPVSPQHRGKPDHRPLGIYADLAASFDDDGAIIRNAVAAKAGRYGVGDVPLVVAVGTFIWDHDHWDSTNAFYGHDVLVLNDMGPEAVAGTRTRSSDGYFGVPPLWRNEKVAAILHVNQLQPHHVQRAEMTLWPHPASTRLPSLPSRIPGSAIRFDAGELAVSPPPFGAREHFALSEPWPDGDAFPGT
jgi:hypothetical protein